MTKKQFESEVRRHLPNHTLGIVQDHGGLGFEIEVSRNNVTSWLQYLKQSSIWRVYTPNPMSKNYIPLSGDGENLASALEQVRQILMLRAKLHEDAAEALA